MSGLLKMLFKQLLYKKDGVDHIENIEELCKAAYYPEKIAMVYSLLLESDHWISNKDILIIADEAYQEVCANV